MGNEILIMPFDKQLKLADAFVKSNLFGVKTVEQALALMALCEAENIHPAKAVQDYHIIQGRPSLKADAMLARFQNSGGKVEWKDYTDAKVTGIFTHPQGGSVEISWDEDRVKKAELSSNPNHKKYPRQMKRARVISEAIRTIYPGVTQGLYVPEEVDDFELKMQDVTPENEYGPSQFKTAGARKEYSTNLIKSYKDATSIIQLEERKLLDDEKLRGMESGSEHDQLAFEEIKKQYISAYRELRRGEKLLKQADTGNFEVGQEDEFQEIPEHMRTTGDAA